MHPNLRSELRGGRDQGLDHDGQLGDSTHASTEGRVPIQFTQQITVVQVYALLDLQGTGEPQTLRILKNLAQPNSVAWYNGTLFVAEPNRLLRYDGADDCIISGKVCC